MTDRLIRITTALAVVAVAVVAAVISYQHAVRHEAPHNREAPGRAGSSPDNDGTYRDYRTVWVRQARQEGVREEPVS